MEPLRIQWRSSTRKDVRRLPPREVARIIEAIGGLAQDPLPHGAHKLSGAQRTYRVRIGDYRVIYEVCADTRVVEIQRIRHRKDVYRE